jgi:MFS family permease
MEAYSIQATSQETLSSKSIQWKQLWSLMALYGSIVIGWIAYQNYQPKLLTQFQFTDFAFLLTVAQGIILVITPPLAGKLGDRYRFSKGHRIPIISSGISFAAMIFMAVAFTLFTNPGEIFKWVLPVLILFWLIAMSIFTSPALSTMELFTPVDKLPRAMAMLTIVANLLYALEPVVVDLIDFIGAPLTFMAGGVVVFLSGYALRRNSLSLFQQSGNKEAKPAKQTVSLRSEYSFILFLGLVLGFATAIMFNVFPDLFQKTVSAAVNINGKIILVDMLVLSALLSWPISNLVNRIGMTKIFWYSFAVIVISMIGIFTIETPFVVFVLIAIYATAFTALSVSSLPLAIKRANYNEKVFSVGIFFSGVAIPDAILESFQAF